MNYFASLGICMRHGDAGRRGNKITDYIDALLILFMKVLTFLFATHTQTHLYLFQYLGYKNKKKQEKGNTNRVRQQNTINYTKKGKVKVYMLPTSKLWHLISSEIFLLFISQSQLFIL